MIKIETKGPFDLILVAQAKSREMRFVTADMRILNSELDFAVDLTD